MNFASTGVVAWTYERDQRRYESNVSRSLKEIIRDSVAVMELAYADAFEIPTFILLHHIMFDEVLKMEREVPTLIRQSQCTLAADWRDIETDLHAVINKGNSS